MAKAPTNPNPQSAAPAAAPADAPAPADNAQAEPVAEDPNAALIPMAHPDGGSTDAFSTDADGNILVPVDAIETMQAHGFVVVSAVTED